MNSTTTKRAPQDTSSPMGLQRAVDLEAKDLEAHRAEYDLATAAALQARAALLAAENAQEEARQAFWDSSDRLDAALLELHAAQRSAAGGVS